MVEIYEDLYPGKLSPQELQTIAQTHDDGNPNLASEHALALLRKEGLDIDETDFFLKLAEHDAFRTEGRRRVLV